MKKIVALLLACTLLFGLCTTAFAKVGNYTSSGYFARDSFSTTSQWAANGVGRAVLTILGALEFGSTGSYSVDLLSLSKDSYIGILSSGAYDIFLPAASGNKYYNIVFWTDGSYDIYTYSLSSAGVASKYPGYYKNSSSDMDSAMNLLLEVFSD